MDMTIPPPEGWRGITRELLRRKGLKEASDTPGEWEAPGGYPRITLYPELGDAVCVPAMGKGVKCNPNEALGWLLALPDMEPT